MKSKLHNNFNGLYNPIFEKDNCGFGLISHMDNKPSHWVIKTSINALQRLTHRGAISDDGKTSDGCGLLIKKPDSFFRYLASMLNIQLNKNYCFGSVFLNKNKKIQKKNKRNITFST